MLATVIQRYYKKSFQFKKERLTEILQASGATFYDCTNAIYKFIKPFLDNKMSIFEEYWAFNILTTNELVKLTMLWTTGPWTKVCAAGIERIEIMVALRKHAYSNILKILPLKNENFQIK